MYITVKQLKAARSLMSWTQADLAMRAGVNIDTIKNIENERGKPHQSTLEKISRAYELAGIEFIRGGVKEADNLVFLRDHEGFSTFLDDVYHTAISHGTKEKPTEVFLFNVVHENWVIWMGEEKWKAHTNRMTRYKDKMDVRIIVRENDWNFPAEAYSKYKWVSEDQFNNQSFYSYHNKLAFLNFKDETAEITVMRQPEFAEGYRTLFRNTWNHVAIDPHRRKS